MVDKTYSPSALLNTAKNQCIATKNTETSTVNQWFPNYAVPLVVRKGLQGGM